MLLPCIDIEPDLPARSTVILLHGLGADGNDFVPMVPQLQLPAEMAVRFLFPNAPSIPITINGGYVIKRCVGHASSPMIGDAFLDDAFGEAVEDDWPFCVLDYIFNHRVSQRGLSSTG